MPISQSEPRKKGATAASAHEKGVEAFYKAVEVDYPGVRPLGPELITALENFTRDQLEANQQGRRPLSVLETIARREVSKLESMVAKPNSLVRGFSAYKNASLTELGIVNQLGN